MIKLGSQVIVLYSKDCMNSVKYPQVFNIKIKLGGSGIQPYSYQKDKICIKCNGLHHAKIKEASGFCYVNDIVLGIMCLLRFYLL